MDAHATVGHIASIVPLLYTGTESTSETRLNALAQQFEGFASSSSLSADVRILYSLLYLGTALLAVKSRLSVVGFPCSQIEQQLSSLLAQIQHQIRQLCKAKVLHGEALQYA